MLFTRTTFIGIDPTAGGKPFTYAAVDYDLHLLALGSGSMEDMLAFAGGQRQAYVGVCAPRRPNQGCMANVEVRQALSPPPHPGRWEDFRLADYQLRRMNISAPRTPGDETKAANWMRNGFALFRRLEGLGYTAFPQEDSELVSLEVYPHASYSILLGVLPLPKNSLEGRLQRQLALHDNDLEVPDPMLIFEEITRHRLLKGVLPLDKLYSAGELDALVAAYTARTAALHPENITLLGDPAEGQVVLPGAALKTRY